MGWEWGEGKSKNNQWLNGDHKSEMTCKQIFFLNQPKSVILIRCSDALTTQRHFSQLQYINN